MVVLTTIYSLEINKLTTGCAVVVEGPLVESQGGKQAVEVAATCLKVVGDCPADTYPLAKKRHSLEYLRTIAHLRPRTNTVAAVARVRSQLAGAIHAFFQQSGFVFVQTPLITASDCEGAGEMFRVTTLDLDHVDSLPRTKNDEGKEIVDFSQDFFAKPAFLTVSGQLGAETHACALGDVYTFGPTFRAENSQTTRHLAEFHMVEPEMAFADLEMAMDNAEAMLRCFEGQPRKLGRIMNDSHFRLMQLGVSCESLDDIAEKLRKEGALGAKLTGAGKGGFVLALFDTSRAQELGLPIVYS